MSASALEPHLYEPSLSEIAVRTLQQGDKVMPMYLLVDISGSMHDVEDLLNQVMSELKQLAQDEPDVADVAHFCLIVFNGTAQVLVSLSDIRDASLPVIRTGGGTNFGEGFRVLDETIKADAQRISATGASMFRPLAWFLSDGAPQDSNWEQEFHNRFAFDEETGRGNRAYPRVVPLGFRDAPMDVLTKLAYPAKDGVAYKSAPGTSPVEAFKAILDFICRTTVSTGATAGTPTGPRHEFPETLPGFTQAPSQYAGGDWIVP